MAICGNCGKSLIIKNGRCIYCGYSVQEAPPKKKIRTTTWTKDVKTSFSAKKKTWGQSLLTKTIIAIVLSMLAGIVLLFVKAWPGCFVAVEMLIMSILLTVFSFIVVNVEDDKSFYKDKETIRRNCIHTFNIILIWGTFFFVVGVVCMLYAWWAVLLAGVVGVIGIVFALGTVYSLIE